MNPTRFLGLFLVIFISSRRNQVEALRCYACTFVAGQQTDTVCIDAPEDVGGQNIVNCDKEYCTILRQELQDPAGKVNSFSRSCEDKPLYLNDVIEDATFKTYFRSCKTDLCNDGTGVSGGSVWRPDGNPGGNLVVPGIPGRSSISTPEKTTFLFVSLLFFGIFFARSHF